MNTTDRAAAAARSIQDRTVYSLAADADCASPDSETSAGAEFLARIRDAVADLIEESPHAFTDAVDADDLQNLNYDGAVSEAVDACLPFETWRIWRTFTDLAAWQEDPTEIGAEASDMQRAAVACLYLIADRLAWSLIEEAAESTPPAAIEEDER